MNICKQYFNLDEDGCVEKAKEIASNVFSGDYTMLQLMEGMHDEITSTDSDKRVKSVQLISKVLSYLQEESVTSTQCSALIEYLCSKLEDHFSLHPATLNALAILCLRIDLEEGIAEKIFRTLFKEVHVPSLMQSDRYAVYDILSSLVDNFSNELKKLGSDFVYGLITAVDGEQDPRNLLKVFDLMHSVIDHDYDVTKFAEEFFDVVGCYFPIDFEPPTNLSGDKAVVTNSQLVFGLRKVLASSTVFAPYFFPLMIEKLDSDVLSAKLDALETLRTSMKVYSSAILQPYLKSIWVSVHKEVVYGVSKDTEELGIDLIKTIVSTLSKSFQSDKEKASVGLMEEMMETCLPCITKNLQEKNVWCSGRLLLAAAEASRLVCEKVISVLMPKLLALIKNTQVMIAEKRLAMELVVCCLKAVSLHNFDHDVQSHPIADTKEDILNNFCKSTSSKEFLHLRTVALAGIAALCNVGAIVSPEDQITIAYTLVTCLQYETDNMVFKDLFATIGFLSSKWPDIALSNILPILKEAVSRIYTADVKVSKRYMDAMCALSTNFQVSSVTCNLLLDSIKIENISEKTSAPILLCLDAICAIVKQNCDNKECVTYFTHALVMPLIGSCVKLSLVSTLPQQCCMSCSGLDTSPKECITWPIMEKSSEIIRCVSQKIDSKEIADDMWDVLTNVFVDRDLRKLCISESISFDPFSNTTLPLQTRLMVMLMSSLAVLTPNTKMLRISTLMKNLMGLCVETTDRHSYVSASKCLAGLLNKNPDEEVLNLVSIVSCEFCALLFTWLLLKVYENGSKMVLSSAADIENRIASLCLIVWVTKALVIRCHPSSMKFCEVLFNLFAYNKLGKMAADSFDIIFRTPKEILNKSCHACIRLMHKQWFFQLVLPRLKEGFQSIPEQQEVNMEEYFDAESKSQNEKANYLTALSHLLHHLPQQVLNQHLQNLLPLLVKSLNSDEGPLLVSVMSTIHNLMQDAESSLVPHANMLINRFLHLTSYKGNIQVRVQSLKCIGVVTLLPTDVILPHKRRVIRELATPLDDKKRLVRREAVKARTAWCLLGDI